MLRINRNTKSFCVLEKPTLTEVSITERYDLQEYICNSPESFFGELGQDLFVLGKEVLPSSTVQDRIDILAIDKEGNCVIVELKRGNHKLHMLQGISYAAMISHWKPDEMLSLLDSEQQDKLLNEFLECDRESINRNQRIMLVAEAYDYALLASAEWLNERFGLEIACCRIAIAKDTTSGSEYLVCSNIYPAPELASEAVSRGRKSEAPKIRWAGWDEALSTVTNPAVKQFFERELQSNDPYLRRRTVRFRVGGKRRFHVGARSDRAYVWQEGRFLGDIEHWQKGLSHKDEVTPVKRGTCLRMILYEESDFNFFKTSVVDLLAVAKWRLNANLDEVEADQDEE
jgi:hypothetical protein